MAISDNNTWRDCGGGVSFALPAIGAAVGAVGPIATSRLDDQLIPFSIEHVSDDSSIVCDTNITEDSSDSVVWETQILRDGQPVAHRIMRWIPGSDMIQIDERITAAGSTVCWRPFGERHATAYIGGGGEHAGAMLPVKPLHHDAESSTQLLGTLGHISYFNQWQYAWTVFCYGESSDNLAIGIFTGWGDDWRGRGGNRIELHRDQQGDYLRLPYFPGRRRWAIVLSSRQQMAVDDTTKRALPNRRKATHADLPQSKLRNWQLDLPAIPKRQSNLIGDIDLLRVRQQIREDEQFRAAMDRYAQAAQPRDPFFASWAFVQQDQKAIKCAIEDMRQWATDADREITDGGYERLIIFDGRHCKRRAYDLDIYWSAGLIGETDYLHIRSFMLKLAYMFADGDFARYQDFWLDRQDADDALLAEQMDNEMGPTPVPPNFAAEFFSTVGVVAELFSDHPLAGRWRDWAMEQLDRFLDRFFESDGTYRESPNYHNHLLNMLICQMWPLREKGVRDYFADRRIVGSFEHFLQIATPPTQQHEMAIPPDAGQPWPAVRHTLFADARKRRRAYINNGNSGNDWCLQPVRGELLLGANVYQQTQPRLASHLAWLWQETGRPVLDGEHSMLTLATLRLTVKPEPLSPQSAHRKGLGIVSRSTHDASAFCLFRAGSATNHMDFDQGAIQLLRHGKVLLGDPGYHAKLPDGKAITAAATCWHNTLIYSHDLANSSGYTGLEQAPEPVAVHLGDDFDWAVHKIVNNNFRRMGELDYRVRVSTPTVAHIRRYLFHKESNCILIEDLIEPPSAPCSFLLHPLAKLIPQSENIFEADCADDVVLRVQFLLPAPLGDVEQHDLGACQQFILRTKGIGRLLTVISADQPGKMVTASLTSEQKIHISQSSGSWHIHLPTVEELDDLPRIDEC